MNNSKKVGCKGGLDVEIRRSKVNDPICREKYNNPGLFISLFENKELFIKIVKEFPYPMHICSPDGTMLYANDKFLQFAKITKPERLYNKHKEVKINKLKEKLCDTNLSISHAFNECGVDYNGNISKLFKQRLGMTPSQYRAMMTKNK
jgi:hypothetical protein